MISKSRIYFILPLFAVFVLEWLIVSPYGITTATYYDELADAFLAGQTSLLRKPPAEMLLLPDPWDPVENLKFRASFFVPGERFQGVHDLTLYDGKLYLQWGPLPALILIPFRWIVGHDLPMGHVVLIVETLAALAYAAATLKLLRLAGLSPQDSMRLRIVFWFVLCPVWTFNLARIAIYEVGIYFSQLFISLTVLSIVQAFDDRLTHGRKKLWLFGLSSTFLGFAIDCRPDITLLGLMVPVILYLWWYIDLPSRRLPPMIVAASLLGGPAAFLLACTLAYNKLRFGSFLEIGQNWQLWGGDESMLLHKLRFLEPARIIPNIWYYFFAPVTVSPRSSILLIPTTLQPIQWMSPELLNLYSNYIGRTSGLFVTTPLTILSLFFPVLFLTKGPGGIEHRLRWIVSLVLLSGFFGGFLPFLAPAIMRYGAEWCMWWIMAGALMVCWIQARLAVRHRLGSVLFDTAVALSTAWSGWAAVSYIISGGGD
jgi:hypothetical protein